MASTQSALNSLQDLCDSFNLSSPCRYACEATDLSSPAVVFAKMTGSGSRGSTKFHYSSKICRD